MGVSDVCGAECGHRGCTENCTLVQGKDPHFPPTWGLDAGSAPSTITSSAQKSPPYKALIISYLETGSVF